MLTELKYNLEMTFRSLIFYVGTVAMISIITFVLFQMFRDRELSQLLKSNIYIQRMFLMIGFSIVVIGIYFALQDTLLLEKSSGRLELLLSNGFRPQRYWFSSTIAAWIAAEIILIFVFLDFCIFRVFFFSNVPMFGLIKNFLYLSFVNIGVSSFLCALVLKIRRIDIVRVLLFLSFYLISFGGNYLIGKIPPDRGSMLVLGVLGIGVVLFILGILIGRKLDSETIVLTIPG